MDRRNLRKAIPSGAILLVIFALLIEAAIGPRVVRRLVATHGIAHAFVHVVAFAGLTVVLSNFIPFRRIPWRPVLLAIAVAISLEIMQSLHFHTRFETYDVFYAVVGSLLGGLGIAFVLAPAQNSIDESRRKVT